MDWNKWKHSELTFKPNYLKIPVNALQFNEDGIAIFNEAYKEVIEHKASYSKIIRTPSGGISFFNHNFTLPCFDIKRTKATVELTICNKYGLFRFMVGLQKTDTNQLITGTKALSKFKEILKKYDIDLKKYEITPEEGLKAKQEIEPPLIRLASDKVRTGKDAIYENVYHADYHESYGTGLALTHPEFRPAIESIHNKRMAYKALKKERALTKEEQDEYDMLKAMLTHSVGMFQSTNVKTINARLAHLSRDAMNNNKRRVQALASEISKAGYQLLAFNTDGIWYRDVNNKGPFHNETEGDKLGCWHNDHLDCKIRFKSAGSYEYIENGKYEPVVRGLTRLDKIKPRTEWVWGDIFQQNAEVIDYVFDEDRGIIKRGE